VLSLSLIRMHLYLFLLNLPWLPWMPTQLAMCVVLCERQDIHFVLGRCST
jgi:hypothetical protein